MKIDFRALAFFLAATALPAVAQTVTGTILGVVTDPSGAVVPRATITAANQANGFTRSAESDAEGNYLITFLPLGAYRVEARSPGFERTLRDSIEVRADERVRVDFALSVRAVLRELESEVNLPETSGGSRVKILRLAITYRGHDSGS